MNDNSSPDISMPKDEEICKTDELADRTYESDAEESIKPVSEEEGLDAAKGGISGGDEEVSEDKEFATFLKLLVKCSKKARELGLEGLSSTTINYYDGGVHVAGKATVKAGNIVGGNQKISSSNCADAYPEDISELKISSVEEIFDQHEKIRDRSFMIALAALEGCNYRDVVNTSQKLQSILQPKEKEEPEHDADLRVSEKKRSDWLKEIRARLSDDDESTEYGPSQIKTVFFENQEDSPTLLRYIWYEYDDYADALLQWLYELGEHSSIEVRLRAASIAGQLARYEFRPVREKIFLPWAKADKQSVQRLTALALSIVAYDENEKTFQQALNILHHWSGLKNSFRLHRAAIVAYGSYIGLLFPQQALDNLRIIAQSGDGRLFSDIAQAVADLFNAGRKVSGLHLTILSTLREWIEQYPQTALHQLSLIIFWGLM